MAWDRPQSWWSQGLTAPLYIVAPELPSENVYLAPCGDRMRWFEVRVGSDGIAYSYDADDAAGDVLLLRELPKRSRRLRGKTGGTDGPGDR